ncbi:MAG: hypothetical protein HQL81_07455 [Magnetococcales bacterium]|nr:hypothetical protein [Magnetococcales bacterium]
MDEFSFVGKRKSDQLLFSPNMLAFTGLTAKSHDFACDHNVIIEKFVYDQSSQFDKYMKFLHQTFSEVHLVKSVVGIVRGIPSESSLGTFCTSSSGNISSLKVVDVFYG